MEKQIQLPTHTVHFQWIRPSNFHTETHCLIFLHEALGSIGQWRDFPTKLCNELVMMGLVYERQGHGNSDPLTKERTDRYLHEYAWNELPALLAELIPMDKKVILVGHSDGGTIALLYAAKFPKQVAGIVTMAAHVINETETRAGIYPAIEAYKAGKLAGLSKYHGDKTDSLFYAWANTWLSPTFENWNIIPDIQNTTCPAIIIQGKGDQYGTEQQVSLILNSLPNSKSLILENCKHHPHLEASERVISNIKAWSKSLF